MAKYVIDESTLTAMGDAIREKVGSTEKLSTAEMISNIKNIKGDSLKLTLDSTKSAAYLFRDYVGGELPDVLSYNTTENVNDMTSMFRRADISYIPSINTSKVTDMMYMFEDCSYLESIPYFDMSNVLDTRYMFNGCSKLKSVKLLDMFNVTYMYNMFSNCHSIETIDIVIPISDKSSLGSLFYGCNSLKKLIIRSCSPNPIPELTSSAFTNCYHLYGTTNSTYNPSGVKDGAVYVPDLYVSKFENHSVWGSFTIKPLSELEE